MHAFKEKYITFIDILGFKKLIERGESGEVSIDEIMGLLRVLENSQFLKELEYCRSICPDSEFVNDDLDFQVTQCSDSVLATCEVSPSGLVHMVDYAKQVAFKMMKKGFMCRGYIDKGTIYHEGGCFFGTGFHTVYRNELTADAFKMYAEERSTPFIKLDKKFLRDIDSCHDECVKKIINRFIKRIDDEAIISPWKIFDLLMSSMDFGEGLVNNIQTIQSEVDKLRTRIRENLSEGNNSAMAKYDHYVGELDFVLAKCDEALSLKDRITNAILPRRPIYGGGGE